MAEPGGGKKWRGTALRTRNGPRGLGWGLVGWWRDGDLSAGERWGWVGLGGMGGSGYVMCWEEVETTVHLSLCLEVFLPDLSIPSNTKVWVIAVKSSDLNMFGNTWLAAPCDVDNQYKGALPFSQLCASTPRRLSPLRFHLFLKHPTSLKLICPFLLTPLSHQQCFWPGQLRLESL